MRPSGLASPEASLATNFVEATPTEQVMPCSSAMVSRIVLGDLRRAAEPAHGAGDVEEGLVERERLDAGRSRCANVAMTASEIAA